MTKTVTRFAPLFAATLALMLGGAAIAQDTTAPAADPTPATDAPPAATDSTATPPAANPGELNLGADADAAPAAPDGIGSTYVKAKFDDWEQRCVKTEDGADPCQLYQLLVDEKKNPDGTTNPVAEISIFGLPKGQKAVAGATIIVPLETLLSEALTMQIDSGKARKYPISWCAQIGCIARVGFTAEDIAAFRKGNKASITIVPVVAPDKPVKVNVSLKGFTAGYDAVNVDNGN